MVRARAATQVYNVTETEGSRGAGAANIPRERAARRSRPVLNIERERERGREGWRAKRTRSARVAQKLLNLIRAWRVAVRERG